MITESKSYESVVKSDIKDPLSPAAAEAAAAALFIAASVSHRHGPPVTRPTTDLTTTSDWRGAREGVGRKGRRNVNVGSCFTETRGDELVFSSGESHLKHVWIIQGGDQYSLFSCCFSKLGTNYRLISQLKLQQIVPWTFMLVNTELYFYIRFSFFFWCLIRAFSCFVREAYSWG